MSKPSLFSRPSIEVGKRGAQLSSLAAMDSSDDEDLPDMRKRVDDDDESEEEDKKKRKKGKRL